MGSDSVCLAYGILDRVLSVLKVRRRLLRVLAAASLSLACKFNEDETRDKFSRYLCDVSYFRKLKKKMSPLEMSKFCKKNPK